AASSAPRGGRGGPGRAPQRRSGQRDYGPVREWALQNGYTVSERGRVPASVLEAYDAAH
ncbi:Lsr2 family DNA-binding protein, partial [Microbacterium sp.]|uniref:Lsr2 family DNA-binding protein n=1 Tax=Microbacterium sp. TaxID=51671 RepID=UPI003C7912F7